MSTEQKSKSIITFKRPSSLPKFSPTEIQIKNYISDNRFKIYLDGLKISNSDLTKYSFTDFVYYSESDSENSTYNILLWTNKFYEKNNKEHMSKKYSEIIINGNYHVGL